MQVTEAQLKEIQARNEARAKEAIERMGTKYTCHPANFMTKRKWMAVLKKSKKAQLNY
jgi:predicted DNA-binding protein (MmcQ/YjbR family)